MSVIRRVSSYIGRLAGANARRPLGGGHCSLFGVSVIRDSTVAMSAFNLPAFVE